LHLRSWSAVVVASLGLLFGDVVQRFFVAPCVWLFPSTRIPVLARFIQMMAWLVTRPVQFFGGCVIPRPARIVPGRPGVLIVMNHQSLFDIPLVIQTVARGYPRIVTRKRYIERWIPTISKMVRLYQYPVVDPSANADEIRKSLEDLEEAARTADVPLAVFPEGTRTRNGEIGRFKKGGLSRILAARPWTVYVFVVDGFWRAAKFKDFVRGLPHVAGKMEHVATLEWTDPGQDPTAFTEEMRGMMSERLSTMRREVVAG
jgi:1-acyl-sn-glycerol-3-phosphate acyltransferase